MIRKIFFLFLIFIAFQQKASACNCNAVVTDEKSIRQYDFIFLGKVIATSGCDKTSKAKFVVDELFRGKSYATTEVEFDCSSDCQMSFLPGQVWIIYANYTGYGQSKVDFCSLSRMQFDNEKDDFNSASHGMSFKDEVLFLETKLGKQKLNEVDKIDQQHHENIIPNPVQATIALVCGIVGVLLLYFIVRKVLR